MNELIAIQMQIVELLNPDTPSLLDYIFISISLLGEWKFLAVASFIVFLKDRSLGKKMLLVFVITLALLFPIKALIDEPRPYVAYKNIREVGWHNEGSSFPSGHAAFAFAYFVILSKTFGRRKTFLGAALLIAFTRLYLGQHYPLDIVAGAGLGLLAGCLTNFIYSKTKLCSWKH